jgi:hypothetical protein
MAGEKELLNWKKVLQGLGSYAVRYENGAEINFAFISNFKRNGVFLYPHFFFFFFWVK